jgi:hypothetical protein
MPTSSLFRIPSHRFISTLFSQLSFRPIPQNHQQPSRRRGGTRRRRSRLGGYFRRTRTAIGERLEHPLIVRISLPGHATREIALTEGPMDWIDLHGRHHGQYWLIKSVASPSRHNSLVAC